MNEAMALAGMTPVMGISNKAGSFLVNVTNHDKDLEEFDKPWGNEIMLTKSLNMDDNLYGVDDYGKFYSKNKYKVMEREDIVEVFQGCDDADETISFIQEEMTIPYDERPIHPKTFMYTMVTGKQMLSEDQMSFDDSLNPVSDIELAFGMKDKEQL